MIKRVRKRDARIVDFDKERIETAITKAFESVNVPIMPVKQIVDEVLVDLEEKDSKETPSVEDISDLIEKVLMEKGYKEVAKSFILYREYRRQIRELRKAVFGEDVKTKLSVNAIKVLEGRCLLRDENGKVVETPEMMFRRVANNIASAEANYAPDKKTAKELIKQHSEEFFELMSSLKFLPNSPALMNAGAALQQLTACFVLPIEDSMNGIFDSLKSVALIQQGGGGTGMSFSRLRPKGDVVKSTFGVASGPVSFMKVFDSATEIIKQGGCIASDSLVRTNKGVLPLGNLLNCPPLGDNKTKYNVYTNDSFDNAYIAEDNGLAEVYCVKTKLGTEIKATYNHKISIIDENGKFSWKEAESLKNGDWIVHVLGGHNGLDVSFPKILYKKHHNSNNVKIPPKMDPQIAELLGLYMADGCISTNGRLIFAVDDKDKELSKRITEIMQCYFNLKLGYVQKKPNDKSVCLVFYSKEVCNFFEKIGCKKDGSLNAFVPSVVFESSAESARAFVRGLFEGDGSTHPGGYPQLASASKKLVKDVQQLLFGLGMVSNISLGPPKSKNRFGKNQMYNLNIIQQSSMDEFIKNVNFISPRKKQALLEKQKEKNIEPYDIIPHQETLLRELYNKSRGVCGKKRAKLGANRKMYRAIQHYLDIRESKRNLSRKKLKELLKEFPELHHEQLIKLLNNKYFYSPIVAIDKEKTNTMDIMVPEKGHFVANSILVHNKRRGASMGVLRVDHPDIIEFITCKQQEGQISNFNISVAITDEFMKALDENAEYDLINPRTKGVVKRVNAKSIFDLIVTMAWNNGEPGVIFIDEINRKNQVPNMGVIESTNPCGEQALLPYESCNLGSINLAAFVDNGKILWDELKKTVELGVRFLDDLIDMNKFPLEAIEKMSKSSRKIGLGVMGWADMLYILKIPYNSDEAIYLADKVMKFIEDVAIETSGKLAEDRGSFPAFKGSLWEKKGYSCMRNAAITTVAPTGTLSMIADVSSGIEPFFSLVYTKTVLGGQDFVYVNALLEEELRKRGLYSESLVYKIKETGTLQGIKEIPDDIKRVFVVSEDVSPEWHVRMQAAFQKRVHSAVSKTINMSNDANVDDVSKAYKLAYSLGCKGLTVYRDGSRQVQVLNKGNKNQSQEKITVKENPAPKQKTIVEVPKDECPVCKKKMVAKEGCYTCISCGYSKCSM